MSYMIEGGGSKTQSKAKKWLYTHPEASHKLFRMITDLNVEYLVGQVRAGAQMLQVFESNAEYLDLRLFKEFCVPYLKEIAGKVKEKLAAELLPVVPMVSFVLLTIFEVIVGIFLSFYFLDHLCQGWFLCPTGQSSS